MFAAQPKREREMKSERVRSVGGVLFHQRWKQTHGWWAKPGINYRVVVLPIVFNCGDA